MDTALTAAMIAAAAAIIAAVVSWFGAFQSRRATDRDHAWERFVWALGVDRSDLGYDISTTVLRNLEDVAWWSESDRRLATQALRRIAADRRPPPHASTAGERTDPDAAAPPSRCT